MPLVDLAHKQLNKWSPIKVKKVFGEKYKHNFKTNYKRKNKIKSLINIRTRVGANSL